MQLRQATDFLLLPFLMAGISSSCHRMYRSASLRANSGWAGKAHENLKVGSWTVDATGDQLTLADVLVWEKEAALEAIVLVAIEHRRTRDQLGLTASKIEEAVRSGMLNLAATDDWNLTFRNGVTGPWITSLPFTITSYVDGIREFLVPMPLDTEN